MREDKAPEVKPVKIDLGCGTTKPLGYLGYDKFPHGTSVDIVMELDDPKVNLGAGDNSVDEIRSYHFFEHIHNYIPLINECHRIMKPTGIMDIVVPFGYTNAFGDPTHVRTFSEESFHYLTDAPPGNYFNPDIKGYWKILKNDWTPMYEEDSEKIIYHKRRELHVVLQPIKNED